MLQKAKAGILLPKVVTEGVTVRVLPNEQHEYLMTVSEVANGYGASKYSIFQAVHNHPEELIEGKHFIRGVNILLTPPLKGVIQPNSILLTKRGIVRLGFFIRSERAKLFRDFAEELIVRVEERRDLFGSSVPPRGVSQKRNHNRLTSERLLDIMQDVCRIEDGGLRMRISNKLMGGFRDGKV